MGKSKRNSGPRPGSNRATKIAQRQALSAAEVRVVRPFSGVSFECDLVAMREFVPSATAGLPLVDESRHLQIATVLPGAVAAMVRKETQEDQLVTGYVALQVQQPPADLAAALAESIRWASTSEPGQSLSVAKPTESSPVLTDIMRTEVDIKITVHQDFNWWIPEGVEASAEVKAAVQQANEVMMPSARVEAEGISAAWWVDAGEKAHIRWVRPEDEDDLMAALARLHASGGLHMGAGSRFAGSFRTHGLLVPVFDLDRDMHVEEWAKPIQELESRLAQALAVSTALSTDERRSRDGLRSRQVTLR
ncbi:MAG: DUF5926 family protein [Mycobacteriaceae bacterium]